MLNLNSLISLLIAVFGLIAVPAAPAQAQNARSWVASNGSGTICSRATPCANFLVALAQTNAGGEINCVDQGDYGDSGGGNVTIGKSVTIDCEGVQARITGPSAFVIAAAATDVVVLRGIDISGNGVSISGINFAGGAALHVEKCVVHDVNGGVGWGIVFQPELASSTTELYVSDTVVMNDNASGTGAGIIVHPIASNTVSKVILNRVETRNNFFGIKADGTLASGGVINMTVRDSVSSGNTANGIVGTTNPSGAAIVMMIDNSTSSHNALGYGVIADGSKTTIALTRSTESGNNFGVGVSNGGQLFSYENNQVVLNSTDGSPTGVVSFK